MKSNSNKSLSLISSLFAKASSTISQDTEILQQDLTVTIEVPSTLVKQICDGKIYLLYETDKIDIFSSWWSQTSSVKKCQLPGSGVHNPS